MSSRGHVHNPDVRAWLVSGSLKRWHKKLRQEELTDMAGPELYLMSFLCEAGGKGHNTSVVHKYVQPLRRCVENYLRLLSQSPRTQGPAPGT